MAYQALILLAVVATASAQSYASSYSSVADPLQTYAPSGPIAPGGPYGQAPSPLSYGALSGSIPYDHQLLLQQPGYDVTEAPQEPENPPSPVPPPAAPISFGPLPQNPLPLLPQSHPQPSLLPQPQPQYQLQPQYQSQADLEPAAPPSQLTSHSSTSFSSPYASYQH